MNNNSEITACVLILGNEILSGKTQDTNLKYLGLELAKLGIKLSESRVLPDEKEIIISAINECRKKYTYIFTTGGIGPTHDDITAECIADAFNLDLEINNDAVNKIMSNPKKGYELNEARLKMATLPSGAKLIDNPLSYAPGFMIENVYVLAGIPSVAKAMFETFRSELKNNSPIESESLDIYIREGDIANPLSLIAKKYTNLDIGSYPFSRKGKYGASIVVRGRDKELIKSVIDEITIAMKNITP
jgi:molybdenum cofactor synthesis domain-containing protein